MLRTARSKKSLKEESGAIKGGAAESIARRFLMRR